MHVANEVQSNNDHLHVDVIVYYYTTINLRKQNNMARDRHLQSSTGVRDENYANKHRIHISERVTHVSISVYLDIVKVIRHHEVLNFIHSYNVRGSGIQEDFIL
jgi:hypothetical protein